MPSTALLIMDVQPSIVSNFLDTEDSFNRLNILTDSTLWPKRLRFAFKWSVDDAWTLYTLTNGKEAIMAKAVSEQTKKTEHTVDTNGSSAKGRAAPHLPPPGRKLTREEALDRTFEKNKELYERLAQ